MNYLKYGFVVLVAGLLTACGGGGGSAGTTSGGSSSTSSATPTVVVTLTDTTGNALGVPVTLQSGSTYLAQAQVLDARSTPIVNQLVSFAGDTSLVTLSPATALTDTSGVARVQVSPLSLAGAGTIVATSSIGGSSVTSNAAAYQVAAKNVAASLTYVSGTPTVAVISSATTGVKQLNAKFQLLNEQGLGLSGQSVTLSLNAQAISSGVTFLANGLNTTASQVLTTDASGNVQAILSSGTLPTPILVTAKLTNNSNIQANSVGLAVTNGRPTQLRSSIAATVLNLEASGGGTSIIQGVQTTISVLLSDRLGNPIPAGTVVNLVASHGQVTGSCLVDATSGCTATWTSAGERPSSGLLTVLAYLDGEEDFVDANGNNQYDAGESFTDVGQVYLPKDPKAAAFNSLVDQPIAGGMTGNVACNSVGSVAYQMPNTCDGLWSSSIRVRKGVTLSWSSGVASWGGVSSNTGAVFTVTVSDDLGNALPNKTALSATGNCTTGTGTATTAVVPALVVSPTTVPNTISPTVVSVALTPTSTLTSFSGGACTINLTATSPAGLVTTRRYSF
ncbi:hypothetical protein PSQ40_11370 [Curvibacter sp. HBC61]|uniref:Big-1 domain-containing protein n=1 Tax=Curvibacter cyanobacteriorum TaxID=3026422 RepID=A0ABT5MYM8_9BURK|nr:hypothetical protein [Curvibacter sp. HBC61]MDD0839175.1 hypothetical protein [Curvibacter sp. HBC61]